MILRDPMRPRKSQRHDLTREQLREFARRHDIKRGQNTADTLRNIKKAGALPALTVFAERIAQAEFVKNLRADGFLPNGDLV
jgi:hypothetical protein